MDETTSTVSRKELYQQVWETPMSRLAQRYGISGNGLAKICDRLRVPYPPHGYWAKKAAGKKVVQYRLQERAADTPDAAVITPTPPPVAAPEMPPEAQQQVDAVTRSVGTVAVHGRLTRPHPVVAGWLADHEWQQQEARREWDPHRRRMLARPGWTESERRQHRILDALFKAAEQQGMRVKQSDRFTVHLEAAGERIDFKLKQKHKQVRTPKSPEELKRLRPGDKSWTQQLQPTDTLVFSLETYVPGLPQRVWADTVDQPLEGRVGEILTALLLAGPLLVKQRREREEAERLRREEEHRRYQEAELKRLDGNRWRRFVELADRWKQADDARRFLAALEQHPGGCEVLPGDMTIAECFAWAHDWLERFDPLARGPGDVFREVLKVTSWTYRD